MVNVVGHNHKTAEEPIKKYSGERRVDLGCSDILWDTQSKNMTQCP